MSTPLEMNELKNTLGEMFATLQSIGNSSNNTTNEVVKDVQEDVRYTIGFGTVILFLFAMGGWCCLQRNVLMIS